MISHPLVRQPAMIALAEGIGLVTLVAAPRRTEALTPGKHTISYEFIPDSAHPGTDGKSIWSVNGKKVAEAHIPKTQPFAFLGDVGADVGWDGETNVSCDYAQGSHAKRFTGKIQSVQVEIK